MKVKELIELLRVPVYMEFRIDNCTYGYCSSDDRLSNDLGYREIEDWFVVFSGRSRICVNLKPWDEVIEQ